MANKKKNKENHKNSFIILFSVFPILLKKLKTNYQELTFKIIQQHQIINDFDDSLFWWICDIESV